jgi:hypothetical protein
MTRVKRKHTVAINQECVFAAAGAPRGQKPLW